MAGMASAAGVAAAGPGAIGCSEVRPLISRFIERDTDPRETLRTRLHLDSCPACRLRADRLGSVMATCDGIAAVEPPADLAVRVMGALRRMKAAGAAGVDLRASKWTGLGVLLAVGAVGLARNDDLADKAALPLRLLARGIIHGSGASNAVETYLSRVAPSLVRLLDADLAASAAASGPDLFALAHIGTVALLLALLLAIPVAAVTAWMLHAGRS